MYYDWTYIFVLIGAVIAMGASAKLKGTYAKYSNVGAACGMTGAQVAQRILQANGIYDVAIGHVGGNLTDHYNPSKKTLSLSDSIYGSTSIAALGVAAHECGHAIQHHVGYSPLNMRSTLVPIANLGSAAAWPFIIIGLMLGSTNLGLIGILLFSFSVAFQLITLPVEYNASSRALRELQNLQILQTQESKYAKEVLDAAALTYVAAAAAAILQMLRLLILFGGNRRRD